MVIDEDASYDISAFDYDAAANLYGMPSTSKSFSAKPMRVSSHLRCATSLRLLCGAAGLCMRAGVVGGGCFFFKVCLPSWFCPLAGVTRHAQNMRKPMAGG